MNRHCCFHIVLLALMFILFTGGACSGSVWYVSVADGNDSNPGTPSLPFLTIQKAVDTASNGDTVLVENGTYFEDVNVDKDGLTLKSLESTGAAIDGTNYAIELTGNGLSVENFYIENSTYGIVISGDQTEDITISSNWFSDISNTAIYFHWDADVDGCTVTIDDNLIFSSGNGIYMEDSMGLLQDVDINIIDNLIDGPSDGIRFNYLYAGSLEISDNSLFDCETSGIYVDTIDSNGEDVSVKIENNNIDLSAGLSGSYGIFMNNAERTTWINGNTVTGDYDSGIHIEYLGLNGSDPLLVYVDENTISGCEWGIYLDQLFADMSGSIYLRNNVISGCTSGTWGDGDGIHLTYVGYGIASSGFNLYCDDNVIFECEDDGLEIEFIFHESTGEVYVRRNSFIDNAYGFYIPNETYLETSTLTVSNNNFEGNVQYGLLNETNVLIDATDNWWGDPSGPYDPNSIDDTPSYDNPTALGDEVSEYVDYDPWRETPYIAGEASSGGCSTGGFDPAIILLILPIMGLICRKRNR